MSFYNEEAFFDAWRRGVEIAGARWFGDGATAPEAASSKWQLEPRQDDSLCCACAGRHPLRDREDET